MPTTETNSPFVPTPDLPPSWQTVLSDEFVKPYWSELAAFLVDEVRSGQQIFPPLDKVFSALHATPFDDVRVVILGQDPYHGDGQAMGLCFSVPPGVSFPPSLHNIFKEIASDVGGEIPKSGDLTPWTKQGVLLLNAVLSVRRNAAASHAGKGWELFTDAIIRSLSEQREGIVFLLWGRYAQEKGILIDETRHHVLKAAHPSPFSADKGFFGSKHFSQTNALLEKMGKEQVVWGMG